MKKLFSARHSIEAHLILAALGEAGIEAVVQGERLEPLMGRVGVVYSEVWIRNEADYERAKAVLAECQNQSNESVQEETIDNDSMQISTEPLPTSTHELTASGRKTALMVALVFTLGVFVLAIVIHPRNRSTNVYDAANSGDVSDIESIARYGDLNAPDPNGLTPLHYAARNRRTAIVKLLLERGANINAKGAKGISPLQEAVWNGNAGIAGILIAAGAAVNAADEDGFTALHFAAENGSDECVSLLLGYGAEMTRRSAKNTTVIHVAAYNGKTSVMEILISKGADINLPGQRNWTALHYAADRGHAAIVEVLIKNGANVEAQGENGCTPLHVAVNANHLEIVRLLLEHHASVNAHGATIASKVYEGKTPLDIALSKGLEDIAKLLRESGGKSGNQTEQSPK